MRSSSPSGSTMCAPVGPGPLDELVLEHQRRDRTLARRRCPRRAGRRGRRRRSGRAAPRPPGSCAADSAVIRPSTAVERRRGRHGALVGPTDRQPHVEAGDQPVDLRRELEPAVEHDARQRRQGARVVREQHAEHDVVAVAGHDDRGALEEPVDDVRHRHRRDDQAEALAVEQLGVAVHEACRRTPPRGRPRSGRAAAAPRAAPRPEPRRAAPRTASEHVVVAAVRHLVDHDAGDVGVAARGPRRRPPTRWPRAHGCRGRGPGRRAPAGCPGRRRSWRWSRTRSGRRRR